MERFNGSIRHKDGFPETEDYALRDDSALGRPGVAELVRGEIGHC